MNSSQSDLDLARRMRAAGIPLEIDEDDFGNLPPAGLSIWQNGESFACDLGGHSTAYIIDLCFLPNLPREVELARITLELPWQDPLFTRLPDPQGESETYLFPGTTLGFDREQVINHRIGTGYALARRRSFSGVLLGLGQDMPKPVHHGIQIPGFVRVSDQFGERYSGHVVLTCDQLTAQRAERREKTRRRLFEAPDPK